MAEPFTTELLLAKLLVTQHGEGEHLLVAIAAQLDAIVRQLMAGFDVAPTQRLQLEGLTAAALSVGIDAESLLEFCRRRIPANAAVQLNAGGGALQFDLWQTRAPVYPSTLD